MVSKPIDERAPRAPAPDDLGVELHKAERRAEEAWALLHELYRAVQGAGGLGPHQRDLDNRVRAAIFAYTGRAGA
jgi:hypothetical protein